MNETLDIRDFSLGNDVDNSDRILLAKADGNYFAGAITVEDFKDNFLKEEFAAKDITFVNVAPTSDGSFIINNDTAECAKLVLSGSNTIFPITITNYSEGSSGKILIFQTGDKKIALNNINAQFTMPKNNGTIFYLEYYCVDNLLYGAGQTVIGDIAVQTPDQIIDFVVTYSDNIVCQLQWSAPKSNLETDQTVDLFDIRYSNTPIDPSVLTVWNSLKKIKNVPTPGTPGTIHQITVTDLKANQEYYIYIKSIKVVNSLSYISQSSDPVYFYTNNVATTDRQSFMINLTEDNVISRKKTTLVDENGVYRDPQLMVDEKEKNKFLSDGTLDLTNKDYQTYWETYKYYRDMMCFNVIIDLYHQYDIDKIHFLSKDKGAVSIYYMKDYGYDWVQIQELEKINFNTWYTINAEFSTARFIKLEWDLEVLGKDGVDGFFDPYYNGDLFSIYNLVIYAANPTGIPDGIKPPKRRYIKDRSFDQVFCTNGHFYQDGRIHSLISGEKVRLFGSGGHFCAFNNNGSLQNFDTISDLRFRMNRIPWVSGNNADGEYLQNTLQNSYKKYGLKPYITFSSNLDWCRYGGSVLIRPVDDYWYPNVWRPVPKAQRRGADDMLAITTNPHHYKTYAKCAYTFAAKYGKNAISNPEDFIWNSIDYPIQEPMDTGLDLLCGLEMTNEQDQSWSGLIGYTLPIENAALLSAQYDGNCNQLVDENNIHTFGQRGIDPNFLVIAGGTAGTNLGWFYNFIIRARQVRTDSVIPVDAFCVHAYSSTAGDQGSSASGIVQAIPFEVGKIGFNREFLKVIDYRDRVAPDKEIWVNEFGYGEGGILDTSSKYQCVTLPGRYINGVLFKDRHRSDVKGAWTIRAVLEMIKDGVSLVNYYSTECEQNFFDDGRWGAGAGMEMFEWQNLTDETPGAKAEAIKQFECGYGRGGFSAFGIFGAFLTNGGYPITGLYWWISVFRYRLKDYIYIGSKTHSDSDKIKIACFKHKTEEKGAYVIYYNDSQNTGITNVTIDVPSSNDTVQKVTVNIPKIINPLTVPVNLADDERRTGMPTSRHERYTNGNWEITNPYIYGTTRASITEAVADYPSDPQEGDEVIVLPTQEENPYFPLVGPVMGKQSGKINGKLAANQYLTSFVSDGITYYETHTNNRLAWRQVDAICDWLTCSETGINYSRGISENIDAVAGNITINISEFPDIYLFDGIPTTSFISEISELSSTTVNASSIKLYWNNNNIEDTSYDVFISTLPETGYTLHKNVPISSTNETVITGLIPDTTYYFKLRPRRNEDYGTLSDFIAAKTNSFLPTPTNLRVTARTSTKISLDWNYIEEQLTDFVYFSIQRSNTDTGFIEVAQVNDKTITQYTDENLTQGLQYFYRVLAVGTNGKSEYSNIVNTSTLTPQESHPEFISATTNKLGTLIIITFDLNLDSSILPQISDFTITESGNNRIITNITYDLTNTTKLQLHINSNAFSNFEQNLPIKVTYTGTSLKSIYGLTVNQFDQKSVKNTIGNFINLNAVYKLNFTYQEYPSADPSLYWNDIAPQYHEPDKPQHDWLFENIFDSYGMPTDINVYIPHTSNTRVGYTLNTNGICTIPNIPEFVYNRGFEVPFESDNTESRVARIQLQNLNTTYRYTFKAFGSRSVVVPTEYLKTKIKVQDQYSNTVDQTQHYGTNGLMILEDIQPTNSTVNVDFIRDIPKTTPAPVIYPKLSFMIVEEYSPSTDEDNKTVYIREANVIEAVDGNIHDTNINIHLNLYGIGLQCRISENLEDLETSQWLDIPDNTLNVPYNITSQYGEVNIYIQVKNAYNESNIKQITVNYVDPYVPLELLSVIINNGVSYTNFNPFEVQFEYNGIPTHYKLGTNPDLTDVSWQEYSQNIQYTISPDVQGYYTIYCQLKDDVNNVTTVILSNQIQYIPIDQDIVEFTITSDQLINASNVQLTFPKLKYDKELVFSYITDDSYSIYNGIFNLINKRYIDNEKMSFWNPTEDRTFFYHLDFQYTYNNIVYDKSEGFTPTKFLEYSDGAGVKHRFATSVAIWPDKFGTYDYNGGWSWMWVTAKEMRMFYDFGYTPLYHDITGYTSDMSQESFDAVVNASAQEFLNLTGRQPKILAEPNGDHTYLTFSQANPTINMLTAQAGDARIQYAYLFAENATLDKNNITVKRDFNTSATYATDMLNTLATLRNTTRTDRKWLIGSSHRPNYGAEMLNPSNEGEYKLFTQIEALYGVSGDDSIWFASVDEVYEYWFMINNTQISSTQLTQNSIKYTLNVAKLDNFWFRSLSCILTGLVGNITITTSDNCSGLSYTKRTQDVLVNLDFNSDLLAKVNKYMDILTNDVTNQYSLENAQYFVQMLKPGLKEQYQAQIDSITSSPVLDSIVINNGDVSTQASTVNIELNTTSLYITHYMVSEDNTFTDTQWLVYNGNQIQYTFEEYTTSEAKIVYVKLKNIYGESNIKQDSINYIAPQPVSLTSITLAGGVTTYEGTSVPVEFNIATGTPSHYRLAESTESLSSSSWVTWTDNITYEFQTAGTKTLYAQIKNETSESAVVSDSITITLPATSVVIGMNSTANYQVQLTTAPNGDVINQIKHNVNQYSNSFTLTSTAGESLSTWKYHELPTYYTANSIFADSGSNAGENNSSADDSGVYPVSTFLRCRTSQNNTHTGTRKLRFSFTLPAGTYDMSILYSPSSSYLLTEAQRLQSYYAVYNGTTELVKQVVGTNGFTGAGNNTYNNTMQFTLDDTTTIDVAAWNDYPQFTAPNALQNRPGINLIKFTKVA